MNNLLNILLVIFNLFILESLLSVDNAAVLAAMVKDLPKDQKPKALRYGLIGAYVFRGMALFFISFLTRFVWLKALGGLYLIYLAYAHFSSKVNSIEEETAPGWALKFTNWCKSKVGVLWSTVILVEIMDMAFSIDNVFAAVALSNKFWIIMTGVAIGILAMRFIAGWFVSLMEKFPQLENSAFIVIGLLGIKLVVSGIAAFFKIEYITNIFESHLTDIFTSVAMMLVFFTPILHKRLVNS